MNQISMEIFTIEKWIKFSHVGVITEIISVVVVRPVWKRSGILKKRTI